MTFFWVAAWHIRHSENNIRNALLGYVSPEARRTHLICLTFYSIHRAHSPFLKKNRLIWEWRQIVNVFACIAVYLAISGSKGPGVPPYFLAESPSFLRISGQVPRHPPPPPLPWGSESASVCWAKTKLYTASSTRAFNHMNEQTFICLLVYSMHIHFQKCTRNVTSTDTHLN